MKKIVLFFLILSATAYTGICQDMQNTGGSITLSNTCLNAPFFNGTYTIELYYVDPDNGPQDLTVSGVTVSTVGSTATLTWPPGGLPTPSTNGYWTLRDAKEGHIALLSGPSGGYMDWYHDENLTLRFNCTALPVWFNSFTGSQSGSNVVLNWQTGLEQYTSVIEVYRSSTAGTLSYYKIGQVTAAGNSNIPVNYTFTDVNPGPSEYYYLRMVSAVGAPAIYSSPIHVSCSGCTYTPPTPVTCAYTINGPDHICNIESLTMYTLSTAVPNYNTIVWSVDQPYAAALYTYPEFNTAKASLLKKNAAAGITLRATLSGCSNVITKVITMGTPTPTIDASIIRCPIVDATMGNAPNATSYEWWFTDENTAITTDYPGAGISKGFMMTSSDTYDVEGAYTNACGTSAQAVAYGFQCGALFSAVKPEMTVSPNPSQGMVTISNAKAKIYQVRVLDAQGVVRKSFSYPGTVGNVSVNLSGLTNGLYTVQVFDNKTWTSSQVLLSK